MVRFARNAATAVGGEYRVRPAPGGPREAQFHGTATTRVNAQGKAVTVLRGGSLNDPNLSDAKRQQLLNELIKKEHDLNVVRQKAIDVAQKLDNAEQGKTKADAANRQSGRQISFDQAASIARAAGLQVNSGFSVQRERLVTAGRRCSTTLRSIGPEIQSHRPGPARTMARTASGRSTSRSRTASRRRRSARSSPTRASA
jgi:hypothetical protein